MPRVPIISPDGVAGTIDASELQSALDNGYKQPPNPLETTGKQIEAGALGVAHGLIPGAPSAIAALGGPSLPEQKALEETHPVTSSIGRFAGAGLQIAGVSALTGGLGELAAPVAGAEEVLPGAEAAEAVGQGVDAATATDAAGATPGAASQAADAAAAQGPATIEDAQAAATATPGGVSKFLGNGYTQQAIAGGAMHGTGYINESELGDHQFNAEALAQQVGIGGLLGLVGEGTINILRETVAPPIIQKAGEALDALKGSASKAFFSASDLVNGLPRGTTEAAGRAIASGAAKMTDEAAEQFAGDANRVGEALSDLGKEHGGADGYRAGSAEKNLADRSRRDVLGNPYSSPSLAPEALEGAAPSASVGIKLEPPSIPRSAAEAALPSKYLNDPAAFDSERLAKDLLKAPTKIEPAFIPGILNPDAPGLFNVARRIEASLDNLPGEGGALGVAKDAFSKMSKVMVNPESTAADLHAAALEFKQAIGDSGIYRILRNPLLEGTPQWDIAKAIEQRVWVPMKDAMLDETIWGSEQAGRNSAFDAAARQKINAAKQVAKDFGAHELDLDSGKNELYLKPSKIRGAFNGDSLQNGEKLQHLNEYIDAAKNYIKEVQADAGTAGAIPPGGKDLEALLDSVTAQRNAAKAYEPVSDLLRLSRQQAPWGLGAGGAAPLAGYAAHALGGGAGVVAPVVAGVAALRAPVKAMQMYAKISGAAAAAQDAIASGVKRIFNSPIGRTEITAAAVSALRGRTIRDDAGNGSSTFERQQKNISKLAADDEAQVQALSQNTARLSGVAPTTTLALHMVGLAALQELNAKLPRNPSPSVIPSENKDWKPPPDQLSAWNALHSALLKPTSFLDACADGTASPVVWQSLCKVYPKWCEGVQSAAIDQIAEHPGLTLTTGQKLCTSMILGSPVSPTVSPSLVASQQSMYAAQVQPSAGGMPKKQTQHGMDKLDLGKRSAIGSERNRR